MAKTSIHFEACNVIKSELHNLRKQELDYIFPELSKNNESLCYVSNLKEREKECRQLYEEKVGQKMQSKTIPIREGVVVINEKTTMEDLELLANEIQKLLGWTPLQIHIHRDEGYMKSPDNKGGSEVAKLNLHAHLIFDCQDKNTGKMHRNNKHQMSQAQDLCANILGMERGQKSTRKHLKSIEYKIAIKEEKFKKLEKQYQNLTAENQSLKKKIDYFQKIFKVSEDEIDDFEIKGFLSSKIDRNRIRQLITSENYKTALNRKLQGENQTLQKKIQEIKDQNTNLTYKITQIQRKYEEQTKEIHKLSYELENPSERYLKQKLSEYPQKEKFMFDVITKKIKEYIQQNWEFYSNKPTELDILYRDSFSIIDENKNIWQLMNTHYEGGQEQFERDMRKEIKRMNQENQNEEEKQGKGRIFKY